MAANEYKRNNKIVNSPFGNSQWNNLLRQVWTVDNKTIKADGKQNVHTCQNAPQSWHVNCNEGKAF